MKKINLKIIPLEANYLLELLSVRNNYLNRLPSLKTKKILKKEHLKWFYNLNNLKKNFYFIVIFRNKIIGCIYIKKTNNKKINYLWGFYTKPNLKIDKLGSNLKYALFEIVFKNLKLTKIYCEVKIDCDWIKDWHIRWGHKLVDQKRNKYILKLTKKTWLKIKTKLKKRLNPNIKINLKL